MTRISAVGRNIVLIGMPGAGKSTVGVLLAKALMRAFLDTDVYIQAREGRRLQDIIDVDGLEVFRALEERHVLSIDLAGSVIATGGSVVYSAAAMQHLASKGVMVHLDLPLQAIAERLTNLDSRGVVRAPGQTLDALYSERLPLYRRYANITIECAGLSHEATVARVVEALGR